MKKYASLFLYIILILCGAYALWCFTCCTSCKKLVGDTLIIGTNAEYPPFSFIRHGEIVGFDIAVATEVAKRLGKKIILIDMPFDMLLPYIQLGEIHGIAAGISPKPSRARHVFFTKPYLENDPLLVITPVTQKRITSIDDLAGKVVVVNDGYTADSYMSQRAHVIIQRLSTPAEALLALKSERADAYVAATSSVQRFLDTHASEYNTYTLEDSSDAYALVISLVYPELVPLVQNALDGMSADGTLDALKKIWGLG